MDMHLIAFHLAFVVLFLNNKIIKTQAQATIASASRCCAENSSFLDSFGIRSIYVKKYLNMVPPCTCFYGYIFHTSKIYYK